MHQIRLGQIRVHESRRGFLQKDEANSEAHRVAGKYLDREGATAEADCESCPAGKLSSAGASSCQSPTCPSNSNAPSGSVTCLCNPGYTGPDGGPCQACGAGTYKDSPGSGSCTACQPGEYSSSLSLVLLSILSPLIVSVPCSKASD